VRYFGSSNESTGRASRCVMLVALGSLGFCGCANVTNLAVRYARSENLGSSVISGTRYRHQIFVSRSPATDVLYVFVEGDGTPWTNQGREIAADPTPHQPLALKLAANTRRSILYIGRPCYFSTVSDAACSSNLWTSERYSAEIVQSMSSAVNQYAAKAGYGHLVLIGYSGGGTMAVLMAPHVPATRAVITIAANLDVEAWAHWHHYLPLTGSENPALQAPLDTSIQQFHLIGGRDSNVPETLNHRYFERRDAGMLWHYPAFDHVCCWVDAWPAILGRIDAALTP
jgi:hypothetical protein